MAMFRVRLPDDLALRFDAAARSEGGRSALLRRLIAGAAAQAAGGAARPGPAPCRLMVRLDAATAAHVADQAQVMQLRPSGWVAALARAHANSGLAFSRRQELALIAIQGELRRIGVNLNQIARALNTAVLEGRVLELELAAVADFQRELRAHLAGVQAAAQGQALYWALEL